MEQVTSDRDFSLISPSARWMILCKGHTDIPFAREVAELLEYPAKYIPDFKKRDLTFWAATYHLETRYRSINQLLEDLKCNNILELSSGYSFRSLEYAKLKGIHYIDTDLADIIANKKEFIRSLIKDESEICGELELLPLNVLEKTSFYEIIGHFPKGEIAIVNEGLMTYLNKQEQEKLCSVIHTILKESGGCWITADIYIKNKQPEFGFQYNDEVTKFYEQHDTEANSFESFAKAEEFFREMGFIVEKEATVKRSEISSFKYLLKCMSIRQIFKYRKVGKVQATWQLKAI